MFFWCVKLMRNYFAQLIQPPLNESRSVRVFGTNREISVRPLTLENLTGFHGVGFNLPFRDSHFSNIHRTLAKLCGIYFSHHWIWDLSPHGSWFSNETSMSCSKKFVCKRVIFISKCIYITIYFFLRGSLFCKGRAYMRTEQIRGNPFARFTEKD